MYYACPFCHSIDYEDDGDGVIIYCYGCGENANGYRAIELSDEEVEEEDYGE